MKFYESGEYRASKDWPYAIAAGCVIYRRNGAAIEMLLLKRDAGMFPELPDGHVDSFHLPKGHMRLGETLEQTAERESSEEAGVTVKLQAYLGAMQSHFVLNKLIQNKTIHYFAAEWVSDLQSIDDEHSSTQWASSSDAFGLVGDQNPKREDEIIRRLQKFLEMSQ